MGIPGWPQFPLASQITVSFNLRFANPGKLIFFAAWWVSCPGQAPFACGSPILCFLALPSTPDSFLQPCIWAQEDEVLLEVSWFLV